MYVTHDALHKQNLYDTGIHVSELTKKCPKLKEFEFKTYHQKYCEKPVLKNNDLGLITICLVCVSSVSTPF